MVFGLFTRKSTLEDTAAASPNNTIDRLPTPTPSITSVARQSPLRFPTALRAVLGSSTTDLTLKDSDLATDSVADGGNTILSPPLPPPETPTPPPVGPNETKSLYDLMLTIPPKTLHAYTLAHLRPAPPPSTSVFSPAFELHLDSTPRPPSPTTVSKLTAFFSALAPPPLLHCVRCHKDFYDVENEEKDKACRVAHDDESTLVSRVYGAVYETLWGCCGQTVPGDGSEGPPDGWCYEGRHTIDVKRARFRSDSTIHRDKLTSCLKLNCHGIRDQLPRRDSHASSSRNIGSSSARKSNPSPARSQASALTSRSTRKRPRKSLKEASGSENEADAERLGVAGKAKQKENVGPSTGKGNEDKSMTVDEPKPKAKAKSRPISRVRAPASTSMIASHSQSISASPVKAKTKPKMTSRTILSHSRTLLTSDSEASTRSRPRTRSLVRGEPHASVSALRGALRQMKENPLEGTRSARDAPKSRSQPTTSDEESAENDYPPWSKGGVFERTRSAQNAPKPRPQRTTPEEESTETDLSSLESEEEVRGRDRKRRRVARD